MRTSIFDISRGPVQKVFAFAVVGTYCVAMLLAELAREIGRSR